MFATQSQTLFEAAGRVIPGGVNSPVRAFRSVGGTPVFMKSARGAYLTDEDGNHYLDLINSWGPMLLGHAHERVQAAVAEAMSSGFSFGTPTRREVEMAELVVSMVPSIEKVRMVNSGTEATMSAVRVARGYTGREKIIKFEGCYHGHGDSFLIAAGSGAATLGVPDSPGVTRGTAQDTLTAPFNDLKAVDALLALHATETAAIILEPVVGNMGLVLPEPGFLEGLRQRCDQHGMLLIFDEVMTGFRLSAAGYQGLTPVRPDLTTLGKIIGGGLPVGAYGGRADVMNFVAPAGPVYQAGTLSGNPLAMAAGYAMLSVLKETPEVYSRLEAAGQRLQQGMEAAFRKVGIPGTVNRIGSMLTPFFTEGPVRNFSEAKAADRDRYGRYFHGLLRRGVYAAPSQFESWFLSTALTDEHLDKIIADHETALQELLLP